MNEYMRQRSQRNAPPRSNGFMGVARAAMIADRLTDRLIVYLQHDPDMPRRTRHEWELAVGDLRRDFARTLTE
jgi:hypothetical protein